MSQDLGRLPDGNALSQQAAEPVPVSSLRASIAGAHTPGPWCINPSYPEIISNEDGDVDIAEVSGWPLELLPEEEANKRLIAAAPELLEALQEAAGWFEGYAAEHYAKAKNAPDYREQHGREVKGKTNADRAKQLRAAIAKATGEVL